MYNFNQAVVLLLCASYRRPCVSCMRLAQKLGGGKAYFVPTSELVNYSVILFSSKVIVCVNRNVLALVVVDLISLSL